MKSFFVVLILLVSTLNLLLSQEQRTYKIINSNQLIIGVDTLKVGISRLRDHLTQNQIDSLGVPYETHWDGDCDSGYYRSHSIKTKDYKLTYNSESNEGFCLDGIEIKLSDDINVSLGDSLQLGYRSNADIPILGSLELINDYYSLDSSYWYKQEGLWIKIYKNNDDVRIFSLHLHSKEFDYNFKKDWMVNGVVFNHESKILPGVLLLGYTGSDSLVQVASTDIDGVFYLRTDKVKKVDIVSLGYEDLKIDSIPEKGKYGNFCLKHRVYEVPSLILFRSGEIKYDTTSYLKQFPVVRNNNKIDYLSYDGCNHVDFEPIMIKAGSPLGGFKDFYGRLASQINYERKYKNVSVDIWFTLTKYGNIELEKITGDRELINEEIAKALESSGDWSRFRMRGRQMDVKMKMKLSFN